jgi:hypothetical protein
VIWIIPSAAELQPKCQQGKWAAKMRKRRKKAGSLLRLLSLFAAKVQGISQRLALL